MQAGARDVPQYAQQVGRGGRDGASTLCVCFFSPADGDGVRDCINRARVGASACLKLLKAIQDCTVVASRTAFLHKCDYDAAGIEAGSVPSVISALTGMRVLMAATPLSSRFSVRPGPRAAVAVADDAVSPCAAFLWRDHMLPQFRSFAPGAQQFARCYIRDLCRFSPFAEYGPGGPREVLDALKQLCGARLLDAEHVEETGCVHTLSILKPIDPASMAVTLHVALAKVAEDQVRSLDDVHQFFGSAGCLNLRLCSRFGTGQETCEVRRGCSCSFCMSDERVAATYGV